MSTHVCTCTYSHACTCTYMCTHVCTCTCSHACIVYYYCYQILNTPQFYIRRQLTLIKTPLSNRQNMTAGVYQVYMKMIYLICYEVRSCCIWLVLIGSYTMKDEYVPVLQLLCNYFGILAISIVMTVR